MPYVLVFLFGALVTAGGLFIGYFAYVAALAKKDRELRKRQQQLAEDAKALGERETAHNAAVARLNQSVAAFDARKVQFDDLVAENARLKQDLFNLHVRQKKLDLDHAAMQRQHEEINQQRTMHIANAEHRLKVADFERQAQVHLDDFVDRDGR